MNIYPIFDLPIQKHSNSVSNYVLVTEKAIHMDDHSMSNLARIGDVLIGTNRNRFWTKTTQYEGTWEEHPFNELPPEYKAWLILVGT